MRPSGVQHTTWLICLTHKWKCLLISKYKHYCWDFKFAVLNTVWNGPYACSMNGAVIVMRFTKTVKLKVLQYIRMKITHVCTQQSVHSTTNIMYDQVKFLACVLTIVNNAIIIVSSIRTCIQALYLSIQKPGHLFPINDICPGVYMSPSTFCIGVHLLLSTGSPRLFRHAYTSPAFIWINTVCAYKPDSLLWNTL